jgi:hypothetical protein
MPSIVVPLDDNGDPAKTPPPDVPRRPIAARRCPEFTDYYRIEWADCDDPGMYETHVPRVGIYITVPARLEPYTDVEGAHYEMIALAEAVLSGEAYDFKRCAVAPIGEHFAFWSPRNSSAIGVAAVVHGEDARDWARNFLGVSS